jgi:O-antigen/teichoic acid export membrane protein
MKLDNSNIIYNYISFFTVGISGILINIFIIKYYDIEVLGNFNLMLSFLIILSQFCVGGMQFSVLKHNSNFHKKLNEVSKSLSSALVLSSLFSVMIILILYLIAPMLEKVFVLDNFALSIYLILPALLFFALNKILLMSLNGLNYMKSYAVFNAFRYVLLLISLVVFYYQDFDNIYLVFIFSISEFILFIGLIIYHYGNILGFKLPKQYWIKRHFYFGIKGMWGGALMETNTRVDILMIGVFLGYGAVGIYSFASMIVEGFAQVYMVLKNNIDPVVGKAYFDKKYNIIYDTIDDIRKKYVPFLVLFGIVAIVLYKPIFIYIFGLDEQMVQNSWSAFIILMIFILVSSFFKPFMGILNQINRPEKFSQIILLGVILNICLNFVLLQILGIYGAALSTGIIFLLESYLLYKIGLRYLN